MNNRIVVLERTDFDDKFNHITRRMISDVVRELLTPIELNINCEINAVKKVAEEHAATMEQFENAMKMFKLDLDEYRLKNHYGF